MTIVYDTVLKRPGCALLQAALGGTEGIAGYFAPEDWLIAPTDDMRVYPVTEDQLERLIEITKTAREGVAR